MQTVYAHCSKLLVSKGQQVSQGEVIAKVGSTGNSTGNHLHLEVRKNGIAYNLDIELDELFCGYSATKDNISEIYEADR